MSKTLIFTATYNELEKDNIKILIEKINDLNLNIDMLIIDDNSPDKTWEILKELEKKMQNLKIIIRNDKSGLDTAHKLAFEYTKNNDYEKFISMDADLSHDPQEIPKMLKILDNFSFVIGSRYIKGGRCEMAGHRLLLSIIGNKIIKKVLGLPSNEFTTSYRGFNIKKLGNFNLNIIQSKGSVFLWKRFF